MNLFSKAALFLAAAGLSAAMVPAQAAPAR
jgi:hypothetical protein